MSNETIARRYATALADAVLSNGDTENVKGELLEWAKLVNDNSNLQEVLSNPSIAHAGKARVLESLIAGTRPSKTTANFLRILLRNGRLGDLGEINERFAKVLDERSGVVTAEIVSARQLGDPERVELKQNLERLTGKRVNVNFETNEELIGGVVTRIGSTVYDGSIRTQLKNLKEQLMNG